MQPYSLQSHNTYGCLSFRQPPAVCLLHPFAELSIRHYPLNEDCQGASRSTLLLFQIDLDLFSSTRLPCTAWACESYSLFLSLIASSIMHKVPWQIDTRSHLTHRSSVHQEPRKLHCFVLLMIVRTGLCQPEVTLCNPHPPSNQEPRQP